LKLFTGDACETGLQFVRVISDLERSLAGDEKQRLIELGNNTKGILAKATLDISLGCPVWRLQHVPFSPTSHPLSLPPPLAPKGLLTLAMQRYQPEDTLS